MGGCLSTKIIQPLSAQNSLAYENILSIQSSNSILELCQLSQKEGSSWTRSSPRWHTEGEAYYVHSVRAELLSTCCLLGLHWLEKKSIIHINILVSLQVWLTLQYCAYFIVISWWEYWVVTKYLYVHKKWKELPFTQNPIQ